MRCEPLLIWVLTLAMLLQTQKFFCDPLSTMGDYNYDRSARLDRQSGKSAQQLRTQFMNDLSAAQKAANRLFGVTQDEGVEVMFFKIKKLYHEARNLKLAT